MLRGRKESEGEVERWGRSGTGEELDGGRNGETDECGTSERVEKEDCWRVLCTGWVGMLKGNGDGGGVGS